MSAITAALAIPYSVATDRVTDYPLTDKAQADRLDELLTGAGAGAAINYNPTLTAAGYTLGNGTLTSTYRRLPGKLVYYKGGLTLGSTTVFSASQILGISLPVPAVAGPMLAAVSALDLGVQAYKCDASVSGAAMQVFVLNASGTYLISSGVISTAPFAWGAGDQCTWAVLYEAS